MNDRIETREAFRILGVSKSIGKELEQRAVTEWLPTSGCEYGNAPDIEVHLDSDPQDPQFGVWIPVVKR